MLTALLGPPPWKSTQPSQPHGTVAAGQGSAGNVLAAFLSFLLPGLGQLTQGRVGSAAGDFFALLFAWAAAFSAFKELASWGVFLPPLVHIRSAANAARWAER